MPKLGKTLANDKPGQVPRGQGPPFGRCLRRPASPFGGQKKASHDRGVISPWRSVAPSRKLGAAQRSRGAMSDQREPVVSEAVAVFHDVSALEAAVEELRAAGFTRHDISLLAAEHALNRK